MSDTLPNDLSGGATSHPEPSRLIGFWVVILAVALVGGRSFLSSINRPAHLDAIAEEIGNLGYMVKNEGIWKNGKMQLNHAGTKILFCESSEKGMGVFCADTSTGQKKMIFEEKEICFGQGPHGVLKVYPWSPDDCRFVYGHQGQGAINGDYDCPNETILSVYNVNSCMEEATLDIPFGQVAELDWLSANTFVCASGVNGQDFYLGEQKDDGQWRLTELNKAIIGTSEPDGQFCSLAAVSSNAVAWLQGNSIWILNVTSETVSKLVDLPENPAIGTTYTFFDYSKEARQFLISCMDTNADTLWRLPLDSPQDLIKIASIKKHTHYDTWADAIWINEAKAFAYISPGSDSGGLVTQNVSDHVAVTYFPESTIQYFTASPDGGHFFVAADINQPGANIWDYDKKSQNLRCMVPASVAPLRYSKNIEPRVARIELSGQKTAAVIIYPPADYNRHRLQRRPVVITSIGFAAAQPYISQYGEAVANAGGYFVIVDRPWDFRSAQGFMNWEEAIDDETSSLLATQVLPIDRNRIFVLSNSAQSIGLTDILKNHPNLYRGAICLVPSGLGSPLELESSRKPLKILISTGQGIDQWLANYQDEAWKSGMVMDYVVHPGAPHEFIAKQSERERIRAILHFIFDN
jgi:hypothetical protein